MVVVVVGGGGRVVVVVATLEVVVGASVVGVVPAASGAFGTGGVVARGRAEQQAQRATTRQPQA